MFKIEWKEGAIRQLRKFEPILSKRIFKKISELKQNPFAKEIKRLRGERAFRLRVGNYRIIFDLDAENKIITILRWEHRKNIY